MDPNIVTGDSFGDYWRYAQRRWREQRWVRLQVISAFLLITAATIREPVLGVALLVGGPVLWALLYPMFRWQVHREWKRARVRKGGAELGEDREIGV